jgi:hypothetical protein
MGGACSTNEEKEECLQVTGGRARGKEPIGRPRRGWVDNIRMGLEEIGWSGVDWIGLTQVRDKWRALVNAVMNLRVP